MKKKEIDINLILLTLYSLLPGLAKICNSQIFMALYIPIVIFWFIKNKVLYIFDIPFILFFTFLCIYSIISFAFPKNSKIGTVLGIGMNIFPLLGYFLFRDGGDVKFFKNLLIVIFIHCSIGIYLYPFFGIADSTNQVIKKLTDGVAYGRMASVSGSLGFGNLVMIGFIISLYYKRNTSLFFFIFVIFSAQRSAWLGSGFAIILYLYFFLCKGKIKNIISVLFLISIFITFGLIFLSKISFDFSFFLSRFEVLFEGSSERTQLWENGIFNFLNNPMGTGIGQVGQIGSRYIISNYKVCPDGDYFRMLSEYGINFVCFFIFVCVVIIYLLCFKSLSKNIMCSLTITLATSLQLIGSNITEFYFDNFLFWCFLGMNIKHARLLFCKGIKYDLSMHGDL